MSFFLQVGNLFRSPPDEKEGRPNDKDDDDEEQEGPETQMPAPEDNESPTFPPPLPKRRGSFAQQRARSLSKVFNQLPNSLPNRKEIEMDVMEYFCHIMLLETDPHKLSYYKKELHQLMETHKLRKYGRFYTRMRLTACCTDIGCIRIEESTDDSDEDSQDDECIPFSVDISKEEWTSTKENFILLKSLFLRQDANASVPTKQEGYNNEAEEGCPIPQENGKLDLVLEKHEMFQESYKEVLILCQIQEILSNFRETLQNLSVTDRDYIKATENAIDEYEGSLLAIFQGKEGYVEPRQETDDPKVIPTELNHFLLTDLYHDTDNLIENLLKHINEIVLNEENVYSHAKLQQKVGYEL